jgi:Zn-dependent protease with chaperone function
MSFLCRISSQFVLAILLSTLAVVPKLLSAQSNRQTPSPEQVQVQTQSSQQAYQLPPDKLAKAIAISRIRNILEIAGSLWSLLFLWLLLITRSWSGIESWARRRSARRWIQGAWFFVAFFLVTTLTSLPLDIYGHHTSLRYGISVQGWASWAGDQAKALGLTLVFGTLILLLFNWIVRRWPQRYWFGLWLVTVPILLLVMLVEPIVIEPLFDKFEPLVQSNPALVAELEKVVARTGTSIPPDRMFLMKASAKTNGLNAYVSGIGATKRIVVWDTTAGRIPDDQVLFIFGHESGHYVLHHIWKGLIATIIALFFIYWACAAAGAALVRRYAAQWGIIEFASRTGFVVLLFVISVAGLIIQPLANGMSRHFEHQADIYGQEAVHTIVPDPQKSAVASFNALGEAWLEDPNPNPFIEFWLYNHPSTQNRANFAARYNPFANGGHGQFFGN